MEETDRRTVVAVDAARAGAAVSPYLTGVNGSRWYDDGLGVWDSQADAPTPAAVEAVARTAIGLIRYPGGTSANLFDWRRAVGPQDRRGCQVVGLSEGFPADSRYGPDEYMRFLDAAGAAPLIMAASAIATPADSAAWVEYMNGPVGTPGGDLRAANGHPEPYGVRLWEVGNEPYVGSERYWMSPDDDMALAQYTFGGTQRQTGQPVGTPCDHRPQASVGTGAPGQRFTVLYPPAVPGSQAVHVDGTTWTPVDGLAGAGPDPVYTFDPVTGAIGFGDGVHGAVPPRGARITADYDSGPHAGFVDHYAAMKAVDPAIEVFANWAPSARGALNGKSFPEFMAEQGQADRYDGVAVHPYTNITRDLGTSRFPDRRAGHDFQMLGDAASQRVVAELGAAVRKHAENPAAHVVVSECGALFFGERDASAYPEYSHAMSHALYVASQWAGFLNLGLAWAVANDFVSEKPGVSRSVLGSRPRFLATADAVVREQLRDLVHGGGRVVVSEVRDNVVVDTRPTPLGAAYPALACAATVDAAGSLHLLVVNRAPDRAVTARVRLDGFSPAAQVSASVVAGDSYDSFNDAEHPLDVQIRRSTSRTDGDGLDWTFEAHAVTLLRFTSR